MKLLRHFLCLIPLLLCAAPSWATITAVHAIATNASCPEPGTTCTLAVTSTGSGHAIIGSMWMPTAGAGTNSISGMSCGGTAVIVSNTIVTNTTLAGSQQMFYILSSTSGTTSCVFTTTSSMNNNGVATMAEFSTTTSGFLFDTSDNRLNASGANPGGVTLILSGSNDVIVQFVTPDASCSAASGSYSGSAVFPGGWGIASAINTASGTAPIWTCGAGIDALSAIALKENTAGSSTPNHGTVF